MNKTSKLKDIADTLGISIATVQRALHNKGGYSKETQRKVLEEAHRINYVVNHAASALRRQSIHIAIVLPAPVGANSYFFRFVWAGIEQAVQDMAMYNIVIDRYYEESGSPEAISIMARLLEEKSIDGLVMRYLGNPDEWNMLLKYKEADVPVFIVNTPDRKSDELNCIKTTELCVGETMADLFAALHGNIKGQLFVIGGSRLISKHVNRVTNFSNVLFSKCPRVMVNEIHLYDNKDRMNQFVSYLKDAKDVVGIYAVSARETVNMCKIVHKLGLSGKITVLGTDVFDELLPYFEDGTLTASVYQYPSQKAYVGFKTLVRTILEPEIEKPLLNLPVALVMKGNARSFCNSQTFFWN